MSAPRARAIGESGRNSSLPIRVGGTTGVRHLFLGNWADLKESLLPLDVYRCGTCKRVEFFDLDLSLPVQRD